MPNIARYIGIEPKDLVFVAEYCGGGFGSKIPGYPNMAIPALMSKKIGRPVMMRITRIEEYAIGSARPTFQGYAKLGFREDGQHDRGRPLHRAGERTAYRRRRFPLGRQCAVVPLPADWRCAGARSRC